jgi:hypothetical protein
VKHVGNRYFGISEDKNSGFGSEIPKITKRDTVVGEDATSVLAHQKFGFRKVKS